MTDESDPLAAEYVLGTLDAAERAEAERRIGRDPAFAAEIEAWQGRFAPMLDGFREETAPTGVLAAVLNRIGRAPASAGDGATVVLLRRQLRVWRSATLVAAALAAALALWLAVDTRLRPATGGAYVAALEQDGRSPAFLVSLDLDRHRMTVVPLAAKQPDGKSYELWMIGPGAAPKSMGVLDTDGPNHPPLPSADPALVTKATYAVTVEPTGGSPTGQPTATPVFVGHLAAAPR